MFTFHRAIFLSQFFTRTPFTHPQNAFARRLLSNGLDVFFHCHRHQITLLCEFEFVWRGKFLTLWEWKDVSHPSSSLSLSPHTQKHNTKFFEFSLSLVHIVCVCSSQLCFCLCLTICVRYCVSDGQTEKWNTKGIRVRGEKFQMLDCRMMMIF